MQSHLSGVQPPYRLASNVIYFHDWRYVHPGYPRWRSRDGESVPLFSAEPVPEMRLEYSWGGTPGLRLRAMPATKSEPVITPENSPLECALFGGNLIHEEGRYRLWVDYWQPEHFGSLTAGHENLCCYCESDDGVTWRFPDLGLMEFRGRRRNSFVYGGPWTVDRGYHGGCVFKDPSAPAEERYKVFHLGKARGAVREKYLRERPDAVDPGAVRPIPTAGPARFTWALFGGTSPDGLEWAPLPDPLLLQNSDTHNICAYDPVRKTYVGYIRTWIMGRRTIGRIESPDFRRFPSPEHVFWPGADMPHTAFWYSNAKTVMPSAPEYHVMFPKRWDVANDQFDFFLATSPDNVIWGLAPGGPVCRPGPRGRWDCGVVAPGCGLVELPGDRTGILYGGADIPHKYPRHAPLGKVAWAWWEKDRLVALECEAEGRFMTQQVTFKGRKVRLNYRTGVEGFVRVGVDGPEGPIAGRAPDDCDTISGNEYGRLVTWHGESDLGHPDDAPLQLRVEMRHAELFSIRFTDG